MANPFNRSIELFLVIYLSPYYYVRAYLIIFNYVINIKIFGRCFKLIRVFNKQRQPLAFLENAYNIGYEKRLNELWLASFSLPLNDSKLKHCQPFNYVEIIDDSDEEYIGLFRIEPSLTRKNESANSIDFTLKHVLATLLDDVLFRYHQTTNLTTKENIEYVLSQQTTQNWQLGQCDFTRYFHYKFENENGLLGPLYGITQTFDEDYQWTYDTQTYPWTLNLVKPSANVTCEIRYGKNQREIEREEDPSNIVNRIYPLGYGEGINQLGIESVNNGVAYLEDANSIAKYGVKSYVWVDRRFENPQSLKDNATALLRKWSTPKVIYRVSAADLSSITGVSIDKFTEGTVVRIIDPDLGVIEQRIHMESKSDIIGAPGEIEIEIGSLTDDIATTNADIERRQQVNEVYAQGATNIDSHDYNDNADQDNPAVIRFYLPEEMVRVNKLDLTFETTEFRTYGRATAGGGATSTTSSSGGGVSTSTSSGGGTSTTSAVGGDHSHLMFTYVGDSSGITGPKRDFIPQGGTGFRVAMEAASNASLYTAGSSGNHSHSVTVPNHAHDFTVPNHAHDFSIPNHTHDISHGIYKLTTLPTAVTIKVDGNTVPHATISAENLDLIPYLATETDGKVVRGWHTVEITPNALGRIMAQITTQFFIQSRGGGNY